MARSASSASTAWCGYRRSAPPACRSTPGPNVESTIVAHSACQPGRPGPQGLGQCTSVSSWRRQTAVSSGCSLAGSCGVSPYSCDSLVAVTSSSPARSAHQQRRRQLHDPVDLPAGHRLVLRHPHPQRGHGAVERESGQRGQLVVGPTLAQRRGEQCLVDVGHVARQLHLVAGAAQHPGREVGPHERARVAEVRHGVRRDAADVHADRPDRQHRLAAQPPDSGTRQAVCRPFSRHPASLHHALTDRPARACQDAGRGQAAGVRTPHLGGA